MKKGNENMNVQIIYYKIVFILFICQHVHGVLPPQVYGDGFNAITNLCQNDGNNLDVNLAIYNGEILIGNRNFDPLAYNYSWTTYTDGTLTKIYQRFGKQQISEPGNGESMGHRQIVNAPAMSVIKYTVIDETGAVAGTCLIGPVIEVAKGEANTENRLSQRFFRRVDCNNVGCEIPFRNTFRRCADGFNPVLYQPDNIYELPRHKCELPVHNVVRL